MPIGVYNHSYANTNHVILDYTAKLEMLLGEKVQIMPDMPTDEEYFELIKPLWLKTKPGHDAQSLRASLSGAFDNPRFEQWASDFMPDYIWSLVDIVGQWGINLGKASMLKCRITQNLCGTDTWAINQPCKCDNCQEYMKAKNPK